MLLLNRLHLSLSGIECRRLAVGNNHVIYTDRHPCPCSHREAGVHQLVAEDNRVFQSDPSVGLVDDRGDRPLLHRLIDKLKRQAGRQDLRQQRPARSRVDQVEGFLSLAAFSQLHLTNPDLDPGMKRQCACIASAAYL